MTAPTPADSRDHTVVGHDGQSRATPTLEMRGIDKLFVGTQVLHRVNLSVHSGEVRGLLGQNGAGKSTLMKVLGGLYTDYRGDVRIDGRPVDLHSPRQALSHGVAVIHQEFSLVPELTVAQNIVLGQEQTRWRGLLRESDQQAARRVHALMDTWGIELPAHKPVNDLSVAAHQMIEILKALSRNARILVMDEPTARLSAPERRQLFGIITTLAKRGVGIVYISHYLDEVLEIANTLTVLRDGKVVFDAPVGDSTVATISAVMLGRELQAADAQIVAQQRALNSDVVMTAEALTREPYFRNVTFSLRRGEVLGVAGLVGSGRTRVLRAISGAMTGFDGTLRLEDRSFAPRSPKDAISAGIAVVPEDRKRQGLILGQSVADNMTLMALGASLTTAGFIRRRACRQRVAKHIDMLQVRPAEPAAPARSLSGGNQQKVVIARALMTRPKILALDQPTAGVDVGTKADIHRLIRDVAASGCAVIVVSDDLDELVAVADRAIVMSHGEIRAETSGTDELTQQTLIDLISTPYPRIPAPATGDGQPTTLTNRLDT